MLANGAVAQNSASNLEGLLEGLQQLADPNSDVARRLLQGSGSALDRSREDGAENLGRSIETPEPRADRTAIRDRLSQTELALARQFCEGRSNENVASILPAIVGFSQIEKDYCRRAGTLVLQHGYTIFDGLLGLRPLSNGAVQDSYVLGPGDELIINLRGQEERIVTTKVDREGRVQLGGLSPLQAGGRSLGEFRDSLESAVSLAFFGTNAFVSLGAVRIASVLVVGEVASPGLRQATGLSSVMDAIGQAGGITKTGSLRSVYLVRGGQRTNLDFYNLLSGSTEAADFVVMEGDRIVVPPIGATVAVLGDVTRPGIYELIDGATPSLGEVIGLAGGTIRPIESNRFSALTFDSEGIEVVSELTSLDNQIGPSSIIFVGRSQGARVGGVHLAGHARLPGRRALETAPTVGALVGDATNLGEDAYLPFAVLQTSDPATGTRRFFAINLRSVIERKEDFRLVDGDRLIVLSTQDIRYLSSPDVQVVLRQADAQERDRASRADEGRSQGASELTRPTVESLLASGRGADLRVPLGSLSRQPPEGVADQPLLPRLCKSLHLLKELVANSREGRFANAVASFGRIDLTQDVEFRRDCRPILERYADLLPFLLENAALVSGEVRRQGPYPATPGTGLDSLISVAGGLTRDADLSRIEVSRFQADPTVRVVQDLSHAPLSSVLVNPGDIVRVGPKFSDRDVGPVQLVGEFIRPGIYSIRRGERLSELIARAGGLTAQSYPFGAVFTRERVRQAEEVALRRLARDLTAAVTVAAARRSVDASAVQAFTELTRDISQAPATGRVVIEADPTVLDVSPERDIVLEPGDRLFIPKRPNSILVTGDVLNPGAMQFVSGARVDDYIDQAGSFQQSADRRRIFVVLPNGAARPVSVSPFNYSHINIPPGSTVVVPKDASPFDAFTFAKDLSTVISQLAITAASLAVIGDN